MDYCAVSRRRWTTKQVDRSRRCLRRPAQRQMTASRSTASVSQPAVSGSSVMLVHTESVHQVRLLAVITVLCWPIGAEY